jgi:hypothetical protein
MPEAVGIKIRTEFPIEATQNVQIERRSNAISVVIRPHESRLVFHHIRTQQQDIAGFELGPQLAKNVASLLWREVTDARTDLHRERVPLEPVQLRRVSHVVRHHRLQLHIR